MERSYSFKEVEKVKRLATREMDVRVKYSGKFNEVTQQQYDEVVAMRDSLAEFKEFFKFQHEFFDHMAKSLESKIVKDLYAEDVPF